MSKCLFFFPETASRFRFRLLPLTPTNKGRNFQQEKRVTNSEADGRQIESVTLLDQLAGMSLLGMQNCSFMVICKCLICAVFCKCPHLTEFY